MTQETINFLTAINAVATVALMLITGIYAYLTRQIALANRAVVRKMEEQTEQLLRPYINIYSSVDPTNMVIILRVENSGRNPAKALCVSIALSTGSQNDLMIITFKLTGRFPATFPCLPPVPNASSIWALDTVFTALQTYVHPYSTSKCRTRELEILTARQRRLISTAI